MNNDVSKIVEEFTDEFESDVPEDFQLPPEGAQVATVIRLVDLGTQYSEKFKNSKRKFWLTFELPESLLEGGESKGMPMTINTEYANTVGQKSNLLKDFKHLGVEEGKPFNAIKLIGQCMQVNIAYVEKDGKTFANVTTVMSLARGQQPHEPVHNLELFSLKKYIAGDKKMLDLFVTFSDYLQKRIKECIELSGNKPGNGSAENNNFVEDEDIPV
jgi:hypothetical protein